MILAAERLLRGLWAGCLCTTGYLAAPVLFALLEDRSVAGQLAGAMFTVATVAGLAIGLVLMGIWVGRGAVRGKRMALALLAMGLLAGNEWLLRPVMEAARLPDGTPGEAFGALHGVSAILWLAATVATLWLAGLKDPGASARAG